MGIIRTDFLNIDNNEYDMLNSKWEMFVQLQPLTFNTIQYSDIGRPDYLSYRIYGLSEYWWILCKFNNIDDVWNDMYVGMDIVIPAESDIISFYNNVRKLND